MWKLCVNILFDVKPFFMLWWFCGMTSSNPAMRLPPSTKEHFVISDKGLRWKNLLHFLSNAKSWLQNILIHKELVEIFLKRPIWAKYEWNCFRSPLFAIIFLLKKTNHTPMFNSPSVAEAVLQTVKLLVDYVVLLLLRHPISTLVVSCFGCQEFPPQLPTMLLPR